MYLPQHFLPIFLTLLGLTPSIASADRKAEKILLSNVKTLTLRKDLKTSHRRVSAVPQLKCIGGVCDLYQVDVLRCKNQGSDYDAENIQWTCTSSLPGEIKLGATDVICEGFEGPDDPYVLKGSCGVEYRLLLTEKGEERYGRRGGGSDYGDGNSKSEKWVGVVFWCIFVGVILWMLYAIFVRDAGVRLGGGEGRNPWGGGGWGGGPGGDDPPPPYSRYSSSKQYGAAPRAGQEGWRPGFWSGALGGAAAGYMAGNRGQAQRPRDYQPTGTMWGNNDNGEGSSSWGGGGRTRSSGSSSSSFSSTRHESSGFGSTSRR
ncbi:hypothetical protein G7Y79_00007g021030 [Physcia stellaris]|nr:hypothetical protein G7Y79_00007g021030 [Physcia stellaris]